MAKLYCKEHGAHLRGLDQKAPDRFAYTKAVFGTIDSGGLRCDKCNLELEAGDPACFLDYFAPSMTDEHGEEEFFGANTSNAVTVWQGNAQPAS